MARPSGLVCSVAKHLVSGEFTIADGRLYDDLRALYEAEDIFIEPSACAAFAGFRGLRTYSDARAYLDEHDLAGKMADAAHVLWATGGRLVPERTRRNICTNACNIR